jgi:Transposase DDE domain
VRHWDKNWPGRILGALPKRKWVKRLQRLGQEVLVRLWRRVDATSPATRSRWQWTWVGDDSLFRKYGRQLGLVGLGWSGQEHRVRLGIDGLLLLVVIGEGKLVVPVDFAVRRPDPEGPGGPCRDKLTWLRVMLDRTWVAVHRRCHRLPPPLIIADSWFGESGLMQHVTTSQQGLLVVEGKTSYSFQLPNGRQVKGQELLTGIDWPWRQSGQVPGLRYARLTATSPTYGRVTLVLVDQPGRDRYYLLCRETLLSAPRLIRAWRRRSWIEHSFRTLKHLLATEACQVQSEDAYYGHLVLRLLASLVLLYTARVVCKGQVTMEELLFRLKHCWRFLNSEMLDLQALSSDLRPRAA